jgi:hypothetical protein
MLKCTNYFRRTNQLYSNCRVCKSLAGLYSTGTVYCIGNDTRNKIACADLRVDLLHDLAEVSGGERLDVVVSAVAEIFLVHLMLGQGNLSQGPGSHIFSSSLLFFF